MEDEACVTASWILMQANAGDASEESREVDGERCDLATYEFD